MVVAAGERAAEIDVQALPVALVVDLGPNSEPAVCPVHKAGSRFRRAFGRLLYWAAAELP